MEGLTFLDKFSKEDVESIGLVFEPNFFTAYFYGDTKAKKLVAYKVYHSSVSLQSHEIKSLKPLYAISFKGEYTLVPQAIFNESEAGTFLSFNTSAQGNDAEWDRIIGLEMVMVYKPDRDSETILASVFPGLRLKHAVGTMLELCRQTHLNDTKIFLNQSGKQFDIVIFKDEKLIFANTILANHSEDIRYFLLFTIRTLHISTTAPIYLLGEAVKNTEVINLLAEYFETIKREPVIDVDLAKISQPNHLDVLFLSTHWPGIYASLCAL